MIKKTHIRLYMRGVILLAAAVYLSSCAKKRYFEEAAIITKKIPIEERVSQMVISAVPGAEPNSEAEELIKEFKPGGIILFGYNISSKENTSAYIKNLQEISSASSGIPLFVSIDQEGGRVIRITEGVTQFPGAMAVGIADDPDLAEKAAEILALELRAMGVNMNFAPVMDVNNNPANPVINTRSFGSDPEAVSKIGSAWIRGQQRGGCVAVAKHFPGHGDTDKDSHVTLPVIRHDMARLRKTELVPFAAAIRAGVDGVMSAHISYPEILKNDTPATHSTFFMTELLRDEMKFNGLVITDDLEMAGASTKSDIGEAAVRAIEAGADMVLFTSYRKSLPKVLAAISKALESGRLTEERINASVNRIIEMKIRYGLIVPEGSEPRADEKKSAVKMRAQAADVNRTLSRKAVFLENGAGISFTENTERLIVTANKIIIESLKNKNGTLVFDSVEAALAYSTKNPSSAARALVLHHANPSDAELKPVGDRYKRAGVKFAVLYTGNPFLVYPHLKTIPVIFTFSPTDESIRQGGLCAAGEFEPRRSINYGLGRK